MEREREKKKRRSERKRGRALLAAGVLSGLSLLRESVTDQSSWHQFRNVELKSLI